MRGSEGMFGSLAGTNIGEKSGKQSLAIWKWLVPMLVLSFLDYYWREQAGFLQA